MQGAWLQTLKTQTSWVSDKRCAFSVSCKNLILLICGQHPSWRTPWYNLFVWWYPSQCSQIVSFGRNTDNTPARPWVQMVSWEVKIGRHRILPPASCHLLMSLSSFHKCYVCPALWICLHLVGYPLVLQSYGIQSAVVEAWAKVTILLTSEQDRC